MSWTLVTGASSGLGLAFCEQLAIRQHNVVMVARRAEILEEQAQRISNVYGVKTEVLVADVGSPEGLKVVCERLKQEESPISLLVNNAGFALAQKIIDGDTKREINAIDVMIKAVMVLSQTAAQAMLERGNGGIINVSSIVSNLTMGTYAAAKTWVEVFTASLAEELADTNVYVTCLKPGTIKTAFFDNTVASPSDVPAIARLTPDYVAEKALDDMARGKTVSVPSFAYKVVDIAQAYAPRSLVRKISSNLYTDRFQI